MNEKEWIAAIESNLGISWPVRVTPVEAGDVILLDREGAGERVPVHWKGQGGEVVVIVDEKGSAHEMAHEGDAVKLFVDVYQTGLAVARRPPRRKDFLTFRRSDDGNRVQDILTALSYPTASKHTHSAIRLTVPLNPLHGVCLRWRWPRCQ